MVPCSNTHIHSRPRCMLEFSSKYYAMGGGVQGSRQSDGINRTHLFGDGESIFLRFGELIHFIPYLKPYFYNKMNML